MLFDLIMRVRVTHSRNSRRFGERHPKRGFSSFHRDDRETVEGILALGTAAFTRSPYARHSNREIAENLNVEENTVNVPISAILRKLQVKSRVEAVVVSNAIRDRAVELGPAREGAGPRWPKY